MGLGMLEGINVAWHLAALAAGLWAFAAVLGARHELRIWENALLPLLLGETTGEALRSPMLRAAHFLMSRPMALAPGVRWRVVWRAQVGARDGEKAGLCGRDAVWALVQLARGLGAHGLGAEGLRQVVAQGPDGRAPTVLWRLDGVAMGLEGVLAGLRELHDRGHMRGRTLTLAYVGSTMENGSALYWDLSGVARTAPTSGSSAAPHSA